MYLRKYWSRTGIPFNNLVIYNHKRTNAPFGVAEPFVNSIVLGEIMFEFVDLARVLSLRTTENALDFIRGLSRGDMEVSFTKRIQIGFSQKYKKDLLLFCKICKKLGLTTDKPYFNKKRGYWDVKISGHENFKKIAQLNLITHSKRKYKLLYGLIKSLQFKKYKYLNAIKEGKNTSGKLANSFSISEIGTRWYLNKLITMGLLTRIEWYNRFNPRIYELTMKGEKELKFYNQIRRELEILQGVINDN